jgi:tRNA(Arg) A34 adenosine deaminase TadA
VHADLLAMITADERLGWSRRPHPLRLAVNLEPCVMCLGAAMTLGISEVYYSLDSPGDGAASVVAGWPASSRHAVVRGSRCGRRDPPGGEQEPVPSLLSDCEGLRVPPVGTDAR